MKYKYKITETELENAFGNLLVIDDFKETSSDFVSLTRKAKSHDVVYDVNITSVATAKILLDYLSYDKSSWDFEPKLNITFFGTIIQFQRRGNCGHINALENGDMLIVEDEVRKALEFYMSKSRIPLGDENLRAGYMSLLKANQTLDAENFSLKVEIDALKNRLEIARLTGL